MRKVTSRAPLKQAGAPIAADALVSQYYLVTQPRRQDLAGGEVNVQDLVAAYRDRMYKLLVMIGTTRNAVEVGSGHDAQLSSAWKTWVLTLLHVMYPTAVDNIDVCRGRTVCPDGLHDILLAIRDGNRALNALGGEITPTRPEVEQHLASIRAAVSRASDFGFPPSEPTSEHILAVLGCCRVGLSSYAYLSLVLFLSGRPVGERRVSINEARPKALEAKFNKGHPWAECSGVIRMSDQTVAGVGQVFELDPTFRIGVMEPMLKLTTVIGSVYDNIIVTNLGLLAFAQLSHVEIISQFLETYPFVTGMREFSREMALLHSDAAEFAGYAGEHKVYLKLLLRDRFKLFDSKKLSRLLALACSVLRQTEQTLTMYVQLDVDPALQSRFDEIRTRLDALESQTEVKPSVLASQAAAAGAIPPPPQDNAPAGPTPGNAPVPPTGP